MTDSGRRQEIQALLARLRKEGRSVRILPVEKDALLGGRLRAGAKLAEHAPPDIMDRWQNLAPTLMMRCYTG